MKDVLTIDELADYTGFKKSYIYKLVHDNLIPFSKPMGKVLFFDKRKIEDWLLHNTHKSNDEIEREAIEYSFRNRKA